ncbi:MAG TPA: F0F1 ATP synthase subunit epsilon [Candidatus Competibacteraceae bacterium]|nr:F0F1 ATP synthase subunit epsilon [Candidatus Competibacteraceae bacterium]MCP5134564.1 F0F1 ATP synthase subunit epsilon [Gammaproteobacteria bacterium]HPF60200.1 F0F1 ATP synthase subunit epsilon [Candidatus Competibacteraceae bacterium]HRY17516.1 F0F1 ATP synthase subunit epsilon [Candidatus Competibacteraceae bacterium]
MHLKVLTPVQTLVDEPAVRVHAEGLEGSFCLLPRHRDWVAALQPGIVGFTTVEGQERFLAVDQGVLTKCGAEVLIAVRRAVREDDLARLRQVVENEFRQLDEQERIARSTLARLEAGMIRQFLKLGEGRR